MGGNLWRKWLGESDEPGRNRVQAFVYSRLWMGVFPSFLAGFAVIFLICYWGNLPVEKSSNKALLSGLLCVVGYAIGVWAAVAPDKDDEEDEVEDSTGKASWIDKVKLAVCCLALVAIFAYPSIERVLSGERTILEGCVELTGKCLMIVCLFVPVYIRLKRKSRGSNRFILILQSVHYLVFMLYLCAQMRKWAAPRHSQRNLLQLSACTVFCKVIIEDE